MATLSASPAVKVIDTLPASTPSALTSTVTCSAVVFDISAVYSPGDPDSLTDPAEPEPLTDILKSESDNPLTGLSLPSRSSIVTVELFPTSRFVGDALTLELPESTPPVSTVNVLDVPLIDPSVAVID